MKAGRRTPPHARQVAQVFPAAAIYDDLCVADLHYDDARTLRRSDRALIVDELSKQRDGEDLTPTWNGYVDVGELYSQPRRTYAAPRYGLRPGVALDLATGWDFSLSLIHI